MNTVAARLAPFGTTIFTEMTRLAQRHSAVNLAQGFPDFDGPDFVKEAAIDAIRAGRSQYARMFGDPGLNSALAARWESLTAQRVDPDTQVTVTSGCTEAIAATMLGVINPGDRVVMFEPFYDSYRASAAMAGAEIRFVTLCPPVDLCAGHVTTAPFWFDMGELERAMTGARAILVNTPHNPTGHVFSRDELERIAFLCAKHNVLAITDEVYEDLTYGHEHVRLATLPGMSERTITLSSLGKTFSLTGWKIGWAITTPDLSRAVRAAHQFLTFATATPLQVGAIAAIERGSDYVAALRARFTQGREFLATTLASLGFGVVMPRGTYFIMADHTEVSRRMGVAGDVEFCRELPARFGVAAIPPSVFYDNPQHGRPLVRFAFCKKQETLEEAATRLRSIIAASR
ncbi:MAG: aminotransferase class I/II-fold pyridoxal phosphate-dependent enzyme [Phycisphaerales bacterium]|nr:aminotransferase class I/II-fold pyridoxal phosphate-dependent enzyme [Phycisphaerales bacterium]